MTTLHLKNSISRSPWRGGFLLIPLVLACFALLPSVQAAPDPAPPPGANTRDGAGSMASVTTGNFNTAFGTFAATSLTTGNNNSAQGNSALFSLTTGGGNAAIGSIALRFNVLGFHNVAVGNTALNSSLGDDNTALGYGALRDVTSGDFNIGVGLLAGLGLTTGNANIYIGTVAGDPAENGTIRIGTTDPFEDVTATFIGGIAHTALPEPYRFVVINQAGQLGAVNLVNSTSAELINKFETAIAQQQKEIKDLTAQLKEQAAQIQKVSAQVELNKPAPRTVNNQ